MDSIFRSFSDPVRLFWYQISVERRIKFRYSSEICNNGGQKSGFTSPQTHGTQLVGTVTWDSVAGPGRTPMPGNNSGRRQPGNSAVPSTVGRLGVDGFWVRDYGGGSG